MDKSVHDSNYTVRGKGGQRWVSYLRPMRLSNGALEEAFLKEFRSEGLRSTAYAGSVGVAGYLLIWAIDFYFNGWSGVAALRRLIVIGLLCLIISIVLFQSEKALKHYCVLLGSLVLVAFVGSVSVTHLFREDDPTSNVNPTAILGLWIIYGFVRLPLRVSIPICIVGSVCALFGSRVTNLHDPTVRTAVYLVIANMLGATHSRSVEIRERDLFLQRRILEQAESDLQDRSRVAELASAEKTRLIAAVGHDLRQPMMAASLHLSVLARKLDAHDVEGSLHQVRRAFESVKALSDTLEHLLLAARYEAGTMPVRIRTVAVAHLLRRLDDIYGSHGQGRVALRIRIPSQGLATLTDEQTLLLALLNLVSNALKFSDPSKKRPRVLVRASLRNGACSIAVIDNGIGISAENIERIWRPFFQIGNNERNREKGVGLGLYLVERALMRLEGHSICVRSRLGYGTCFVLTLPRMDPTEVDDSESGVRPELVDFHSVDLRGMYVLVIEDDLQVREALQELLSEWKVLWAGGATLEDALRAHSASERTVDAILVDFRLPGEMSGDVVIKEIRRRLGYEVDAVLMTADSDQSSDLARDLPIRTNLLLKPFDPALLHKTLSTALAHALAAEQLLWPVKEDRNDRIT